MFKLLFATDMFAMRGIDYRAPNVGLSLIVAAPFENPREAIQGFHRVGRFQDPCKRYIVEGIKEVD